MASERLPAVVSPYGPYAGMALHVHDLTIRGHHSETLVAAERAEAILRILGDDRTRRVSRLGRMYALSALGRVDEALRVGEELAADGAALTGPRSTDAKILADTARMLIQAGRMDDGLHRLAYAMAMLDVAPRKSLRYFSAMASLCESAKSAELFELAEVAMLNALDAFDTPDDLYRSSAELQYAELLIEWALRLEQVQRDEEAAVLVDKSMAMLRYWMERAVDSPLGMALLAVCYAKTGLHAESQTIVDELLLRMRGEGQDHEARLLHLAHGLNLRAAGELRAARREFLAADELCVRPSQRLIFQYELAVTATRDQPGEATRTVLAALHSHIRMLWQLRLDRRTMLQQAYRRVELEAARTTADLAATSDALTGLGNRRLFDRRMVSAGDAGSTLLLIDVDRFKDINDAFSHGVGDRVLVEIAAVLHAHTRHGEAAVRFGGDEFAVFLETSEHEARQVAERIRQVVLARDWNAIAPGLRVTLSMGLAACRPGETGRDLYDRADSRLYAAKRAGRNRLAAA
ncbi:diguanylate cyclase [Actinoplanes sp. NBRC 14428]|uniref:Diguanylate cyclase (GGDEF)-like protein n=1 Tax=Pseudosporangium ferrugineum TaxID=439699 RepID=A0A2T0RF56_9ACTN|nr:GGDEF domain-containing protein [Pseudosporangium ferrugineum]PRY19834.1 diguanylate cyclase (GGDEF)-like protein [Pseudosporangium ferrugineum]BCJ50532.1 diguanylate cyclase [Actinoplanes sp. NBRC 14428]